MESAVMLIEGPEARPLLCTHRWLLETPNGPRVRGRCKLCGTEREFPTTADDVWYGEPWGHRDWQTSVRRESTDGRKE